MKGSITLIGMLNERSQLKITVEDTGIGISPKDLLRIFTPFGKLDDSHNLNPQGCGLGLSISNQLVKKLGGSGICVASTEGKGSAFSFCVDIQALDHESVSDISLPTDHETSEGGPFNLLPDSFDWTGGRSFQETQQYPTILIVDDSPFNRVVAQRLVESQGLMTVCASSGEQAVELVQQAEDSGHGFQFVLMDVEMPGMNGLDATKELRRREKEKKPVRKLAIVGCSANSSNEDRDAAIEAGMDNFLEKPIARTQLHTILSQYLL